jgi:hypothetical protein
LAATCHDDYIAETNATQWLITLDTDSYRQKIEKLIPQYDVFLTCPGPMLRSSGTAVQLNLPCSYCNTCTVNLFSGPHFGDEHHNQKLCAQYHYSRATSPTEIHMYVLCTCMCVCECVLTISQHKNFHFNMYIKKWNYFDLPSPFNHPIQPISPKFLPSSTTKALHTILLNICFKLHDSSLSAVPGQ